MQYKIRQLWMFECILKNIHCTVVWKWILHLITKDSFYRDYFVCVDITRSVGDISNTQLPLNIIIKTIERFKKKQRIQCLYLFNWDYLGTQAKTVKHKQVSLKSTHTTTSCFVLLKAIHLQIKVKKAGNKNYSP